MAVLKEKTSLKIFQNLKAQESKIRINYDEYSFSFKEKIRFFAEGTAIVILFSYIFYRSVIVAFIMLPVVFVYIKQKKKECIKKRKVMLSIQFRELMNTVIAGLQAGYSIENAFVRANQDLILLCGRNSLIVLEMKIIIEGLRNNQNIEILLVDFANRSGVQDIKDFAEVFVIAKRSGGDMIKNLRQTAVIISEKMDIRRKIETLISSKKLEQSIMNVVPFGIILYIDMTSPGFFDALYLNVTGIIIMTVLMIIYIVAFLMAKKIVDIEV